MFSFTVAPGVSCTHGALRPIFRAICCWRHFHDASSKLKMELVTLP